MILLRGITGRTTIAIIYNNILALPDGKVIGVVLGHCVFGKDGKVKAKYFKHTLFTLEGNVLARENEDSTPVLIDIAKLLQDAWELIPRIKDHACPIISPHEKWASATVDEYFALQS